MNFTNPTGFAIRCYHYLRPTDNPTYLGQSADCDVFGADFCIMYQIRKYSTMPLIIYFSVIQVVASFTADRGLRKTLYWRKCGGKRTSASCFLLKNVFLVVFVSRIIATLWTFLSCQTKSASERNAAFLRMPQQFLALHMFTVQSVF